MKRNMGTIDRSTRAVLVVVAVAVAFAVGAGSVLGVILFALAAIMLVTAAVGFCPLYTLAKLDTLRRKTAPHA